MLCRFLTGGWGGEEFNGMPEGRLLDFGGDLLRAHGCSVCRVIKVLRHDFKTGSEFHRAVMLTSIWVFKGNA